MLTLYEEQRAALFGPEHLALTEASTKSGKTTAALLWLLDRACDPQRKRGDAVWWVAPVYSQALIPFRRMSSALNGKRKKQVAVNNQALTVTLPNGVRIEFKTGKIPDNLYGEDVYAAVIDEGSRQSRESIVAVRTTLTATHGPWRILGNVRGRGNYFYELCRAAEAGRLPDATYHHINAYTAAAHNLPGLPTLADIESAKAELPPSAFRELFLAEPAGSDVNPFGIDAPRACVGPLADGPVVAFGVDLAQSVDYTVVVGLNAAAQVCYYDRWQGPWSTTVPRIVSALGTTPALVDATGVGSPVLSQLTEAGCYGAQGYVFTGPSKQRLVAGLQMAVQQNRVRYPSTFLDELTVFEYKYTTAGNVQYSAPPGYHDDIVCALALAVRCFNEPRWSPGVL